MKKFLFTKWICLSVNCNHTLSRSHDTLPDLIFFKFGQIYMCFSCCLFSVNIFLNKWKLQLSPYCNLDHWFCLDLNQLWWVPTDNVESRTHLGELQGSLHVNFYLTLISLLQFASEKDDVHFRPTEHDFVVLAHWNNTCHSTWTHYHDSEPPSLCSYSSCLAVKQQYQFYSLWFDLVRTKTNDLPQLQSSKLAQAGMSIDFEIAGEHWKVAGKLLSAACRAPSTAGGLGATQGLQKLWDKWCKILHSRPLLALNFIIETSFFCTIFLIYFFTFF